MIPPQKLQNKCGHTLVLADRCYLYYRRAFSSWILLKIILLYKVTLCLTSNWVRHESSRFNRPDSSCIALLCWLEHPFPPYSLLPLGHAQYVEYGNGQRLISSWKTRGTGSLSMSMQQANQKRLDKALPAQVDGLAIYIEMFHLKKKKLQGRLASMASVYCCMHAYNCGQMSNALATSSISTTELAFLIWRSQSQI